MPAGRVPQIKGNPLTGQILGMLVSLFSGGKARAHQTEERLGREAEARGVSKTAWERGLEATEAARAGKLYGGLRPPREGTGAPGPPAAPTGPPPAQQKPPASPRQPMKMLMGEPTIVGEGPEPAPIPPALPWPPMEDVERAGRGQAEPSFLMRRKPGVPEPTEEKVPFGGLFRTPRPGERPSEEWERGMREKAHLLGAMGPGEKMTAKQREARDPLIQKQKRKKYAQKVDLIAKNLKAKMAYAGYSKKLQAEYLDVFKQKAHEASPAAAFGFGEGYRPGGFEDIDVEGAAQQAFEAFEKMGGARGGRKGAKQPSVPADLRPLYDQIRKKHGKSHEEALELAKKAKARGVK